MVAGLYASGSATSSVNTSRGISISAGPPRPVLSCVKARRNTFGNSEVRMIGSADLVTWRMLSTELKFGSTQASDRG